MKGKKLMLTLAVLFAAAYVIFGIRIAQDTKIILEKAMSGDPDFSHYINQTAFQTINPIQRGLTASHFEFDKELHDVGAILPVHFFFISKVFVTQQYENAHFGFKEPVCLDLKLTSGDWYATKAHIQP
ncbi:hypothetical protein [Paenibacillus ihbetae]|uniref:DUF4359 domain-containing protein n=1 Tax=Paenibacillus ihbetae TaxID=1870820 RepID=A0ABX3JYU7_9BACL|nr:hypothetical protein [Paenibacillus ihbetae]OOC62173.1 hypothetical protein BBD40_10080 [Paenibacillus ihbetae]